MLKLKRQSAVSRQSQRGSAMLEFTVVGPIIMLVGLAVVQYALVFNAKNVANHAAFMAARAATMHNASLESAMAAYAKGLIPLYGGGKNEVEILAALGKAKLDLSTGVTTAAVASSSKGIQAEAAPSAGSAQAQTANVPAPALRVTLLNPTKESFDDWADSSLSATVGRDKGKSGVGSNARVISNSDLISQNVGKIGETSGQNIQDANLLKLKVEYGYELKVPLISTMWQFLMRYADKARGVSPTSFEYRQHERRRIPLTMTITMHMQSDAIEPKNPVSSPGKGNEGKATDPGFTEPPAVDAPTCLTIGCTVIEKPNTGTGTSTGIGTGGTNGTGTGGSTVYSCLAGDPNCEAVCTKPASTSSPPASSGTGLTTGNLGLSTQKCTAQSKLTDLCTP